MFSGYYDGYGRRLNEWDLVTAICQDGVVLGEICEVEDKRWCIMPKEKGMPCPQVWECSSIIKVRYPDEK